MNNISSIEGLGALYGEVVQGVLDKVQPTVTPQYQRWIN